MILIVQVMMMITATTKNTTTSTKTTSKIMMIKTTTPEWKKQKTCMVTIFGRGWGGLYMSKSPAIKVFMGLAIIVEAHNVPSKFGS